MSPSLIERTKKWGKSITKTEVHEDKLEGGAGFSLPVYFIELLARMKSETTTRQEIREEIQPRVSELIILIDDIIVEIERSEKQVLVIIDNLEKCDYEKALNLFYYHSTQLTQPICKIIYTFPISLRSSDKFAQIKMSFGDDIIYPNTKVHEKDESITREPAGRAFMKKIVMKRVSLDLFTPEALEYIMDINLSVLEYKNGRGRYDLDPIVRSILKEKNLLPRR